ncbi:MAG: SpoIIE family protein phosphatase [Deltaproteobacteria bacterium]|nr:SpoIIE family protein phosphatase [Deltaproteobacteria bacterium]
MLNPKYKSLKSRFAATIVVLYCIIGIVTYFAFNLVADHVVTALGTNYAVTQALFEKSKLISAIQRDLSLSIKMSESPLLKRWVLDEENDALKKMAAEELESYRTSLTGQSLFFIIGPSRHYYYSDGRETTALDKPNYVLDLANINDAWYFRAMRDVDMFELNVDYDYHLNLTKVWFNVLIKDVSHNKIGLCGSGIDITKFIKEMVNSEQKGVETILLGRDGSIEGHRNVDYVIRNSMVRGTQKKISIYELLDDDLDKGVLQKALDSLSSGIQEVKTLQLSMEGHQYLAAISHIKDIRWFNLVLVDVAQVVSIRDFLPILAVTIAAMLSLIVIIGLRLNKLVLSPLSTLAASSLEIARGHYDISMPVHSDDEIGGLTRSFNDMARMVKDYTENLEQKVNERTEALNRSNQMLAKSNDQIMDSIRYARLIQASILPDEEIIQKHIRDFFVLYRPKDIVGGDFYYFRMCGDSFIIAVIDCTGHGVPGAFMTMTTKAVLDHVVDSIDHYDPAATLRELNRQMRETIHHDKVDIIIDNGLDIGLCWCIPSLGRLVFAGAGLDLHLVSNGQPETIVGDKQAIGYRRSKLDFTYRNHTVDLKNDVSFYLTTDGLLDQPGEGRGWGYGRKRFDLLLTAISGLSAEEQKKAMNEALARYQGEYDQRDDITIIGFRLENHN